MAAVLPRMLEMEREYGSLAAAMIRSFTRRSTPAPTTSRPKPKGFTFSFPLGNETLPGRLAQSLDIRYDQSDAQVGIAPVTVLTTPAYSAASIVEKTHPNIAKLLTQIRYSPMVVAATSLSEYSFKEPLQGFGFLVPRSERLHLLGTIFSSALFPGRAPNGRVLLTSFIGGSFEPEVLKWPDDQIWETVCSELQQVLRSDARPEPIALRRHMTALPQYNIGHERCVSAIREELQRTPGLFVTSNYLEGASVPACIEQGEKTAHQVAAYLRRAS
jgi:oxygen-dependent protoporphyrinogen oxidase